ncbi:MAG: stalk domain-containing protein [Anaerovorax sp.]
MKKFISLCLVLVLIGSVTTVANGETKDSKVVFTANKLNEVGVFAVDMTVQGATFNGLQFALRFDPKVLQPVDEKGRKTNNFSAFADNAPWLSTVGCSVNGETGFVGFCGYIFPGTNGALIKNGEAAVGNTRETLFTFRFKKLTDGDPKLKIATKSQGEPYEHAFPEGAGIMGRNGVTDATITFDLSGINKGTTSENTPSIGGGGGSSVEDLGNVALGEKQEKEYTEDQLLKDTLILNLGNPAVVAHGGVMAFYPGEKQIVPYVDKNQRTVVPLRFIGEQLGATVKWVQDTQTVIITQEQRIISMKIGSTKYTINGKAYTMDTAPVLLSGGNGNVRTMVPVRFVAEALGKTVKWDNLRQLVIIAPGDYKWEDKGNMEENILRKGTELLQMYNKFV